MPRRPRRPMGCPSRSSSRLHRSAWLACRSPSSMPPWRVSRRSRSLDVGPTGRFAAGLPGRCRGQVDRVDQSPAEQL
eukprot:6910056-Alexandrium_andersonii.AAC.1